MWKKPAGYFVGWAVALNAPWSATHREVTPQGIASLWPISASVPNHVGATRSPTGVKCSTTWGFWRSQPVSGRVRARASRSMSTSQAVKILGVFRAIECTNPTLTEIRASRRSGAPEAPPCLLWRREERQPKRRTEGRGARSSDKRSPFPKRPDADNRAAPAWRPSNRTSSAISEASRDGASTDSERTSPSIAPDSTPSDSTTLF